MTDHFDEWVVRKSLLESSDHRVGEVECNAMETRMDQPHERQQSAVTTPEIENPIHARWQTLEQRCLTFRAMRNGIRLLQIRNRVLGQVPKIAVLRVHVRHARDDK